LGVETVLNQPGGRTIRSFEALAFAPLLWCMTEWMHTTHIWLTGSMAEEREMQSRLLQRCVLSFVIILGRQI